MVNPRIPQMQKFMFCCSLRTGALVVATTSIMLCALYCVALLSLMMYYMTETMELNFIQKMMLKEGFSVEKAKYLSLHAGILFILCAVLEAFSVFLLIGIKQYNAQYILSWAIVATSMNIFQAFMLFVYFLNMRRPFDYRIDLYPVLDICLCFYVALIVYSYYRELIKMRNQPRTFRNEA